MTVLTLEKELSEYFLSTRLEDIESLTPTTVFKISLKDNEFLNNVLGETKGNFRNVIRKALIKAYIKCNFNDEQLSEISKTVKEYQRIDLFIEIPVDITIQNISAEEHERKIITFDCQVSSVGQEYAEAIQALFICKGCRDGQEYSFDIYEERPECPICEERLTRIGNSESETIKSIYVKDGKDITFTVKLHREQTKQFKMNEYIRVTGMFKSIPMKNTEVSKIIIDAVSVTSIEKPKDKLPTPEKIEEYKKLAKEGKLRDLLVRSFAYYITGNSDQKMALLLALVGGNKTENKRGRIHVLIVGPPGSAKSSTSKFIKAVSRKGCLTSIPSASKFGLFFGVVDTPDGKKALGAGVLVKYNGGHVFLDEFEKGDKVIYDMILTAMENEEYSRPITGYGNPTFPCSTTIIACTNPVFAEWNDRLSILENLGLTDRVVSRFDIVIRLYDIPDAQKDFELAKFILNDANEKRPENTLSEEELNEFLNYARLLEPTMSEKAIYKLSLAFSERGKYKKNSLIDNRRIVVSKRKAEAFAKLDLQEEVTEEYADMAVEFYKKELATFGLTLAEADKLSQTGLLKDMGRTSKDVAFRVLYHEMKKIVEEGCVFVDDIVTQMVSSGKWKSAEEARIYISQLTKNGVISVQQPSNEVTLV